MCQVLGTTAGYRRCRETETVTISHGKISTSALAASRPSRCNIVAHNAIGSGLVGRRGRFGWDTTSCFGWDTTSTSSFHTTGNFYTSGFHTSSFYVTLGVPA